MALNGWIPDEIVTPEIKGVYDRGSAVLRNSTPEDMESHTDTVPVAGSGSVSVVENESAVLGDDAVTDGTVQVEASIFKEVVPLNAVNLQDAGPSRAASLDARMNSTREAFGRTFDLACLAAGTIQTAAATPARKSKLPFNSVGRVARLAGNTVNVAANANLTKAHIDGAVESVLSSTRVNMEALRWFMTPNLLSDVSNIGSSAGGPYYVDPRGENVPARLANIPVEITLGCNARTNLVDNTATDRRHCLILVDTSQFGVGRAAIDEDMDGSSGFLVIPKMTTEVSLQNRIVFLARYGFAIAQDPNTASNTPAYVITKAL